MVHDITNIDNLIRSYITSNMRDKFPDLDISANSPLDDMIIQPCINLMSSLIERSNRLEMMQSLGNAAYMTEEELDLKGENSYFMSRRQGEPASTMLTLFFANLNLEDPKFKLEIPAGLIFSTASGAEFQTFAGITLGPEDLKKGYDKYKMVYEVEISAQATDIGDAYNVAAGEINELRTYFSNSFIGVTNKSPVTNGKNKEDNESYAQRIKDWYMSRQLGTKPGYRSFILDSFNEVQDVFVVGYGDKYMERDKVTILNDFEEKEEIHIGGKIDIYVRGCKYDTVITEILANTSCLVINAKYDDLVDTGKIKIYNMTDESKLPVIKSITKISAVEFEGKYTDYTKIIIDNDGDKSYDSTVVNDMQLVYSHKKDGIVISEQHFFNAGHTGATLGSPLTEITDIEITDIGKLQGDISKKYELTFEGVRGTTDETAYIEMKNIDDIPNGSLIRVSHIINDTLRRCNLSLNEEHNRIITADVIVKEATSVYVNIKFKVKLSDKRRMFEFEEMKNRLKNSVVNFFRTYHMGDSVEESDLVAWLYSDESVKEYIQYVALPFDVFYIPKEIDEEIPSDGSEHALNGVLPITEIEYPVLNTPKFDIEILL